MLRFFARQLQLPILSAVFFASFLFVHTSLSAQITCTGTACDYIPLTPEEYNQAFYEIQNQYTRGLFDDMAEALVIANITTPYIGTVNLQGVTFGANVGAGYTEGNEIDIDVPGVGIIEDIPSGGAAINGRLFGGVNLGWLLSQPFDPYAEDENGDRRTPSLLALSRFDVYFGGFKHTQTFSDEYNIDGRLRATVRSESFEVRYHLIEGSEVFGGPLLRFRGVSLGAGYASSAQRLRFAQEDTEPLGLNLVEGVRLEWIGQNVALLENNVRSTMIELHTGIQLLYFLNLTIGGGIAKSKGQTDFFLTRYGPVYVSGSDPLSALLGNNSQGNALLTLSLLEQGEVPEDLHYLKGGVEFNLWALKIGIQGTMTRANYGANVGLRFEF